MPPSGAKAPGGSAISPGRERRQLGGGDHDEHRYGQQLRIALESMEGCCPVSESRLRGILVSDRKSRGAEGQVLLMLEGFLKEQGDILR